MRMTPRVIVKKLIRRWSISSSARCCDRHALLMISWFTTMSQNNVSDNGSDWCSDTTRRPITTKYSNGDPFTILQFNANGIGNKQAELGEFLGRHKVKVAVIQESKLTLNCRTPNIQNFTTVRKDRYRGQ